ncbi:glycerophosphodiester phosphodiesterase family protein [Rhabdaerophilum sp.]|uniref:glycerophosphodiester phosphodiesterase family protein n=1 Tax=Rhabdaerophilum sp. TaxID=2717341 RepID=UPI0038D438FE
MAFASPQLEAVFARAIAHRGLHDAAAGVIENTRSAFAAALHAGFGMECDLQISADGEAMVFHDFTLDRLTTSSGRVDQMTANQIRHVSFKAGGDRIQSLAELLMQVEGQQALVVEVKSRFDGNTAICTRIAALVKAYSGPLALKSFDPAMIRALRAAGVARPLGIVAMNAYEYPDYAGLSAEQKHALGNLLHFGETRPDFLSWKHQDLPSAAPYLCRSQLGLPVMGWTIRSAEEAARARPHIDQIVFEGFQPP